MVLRRIAGSISYSATGFSRFFDDITTYGLEKIGLYYGNYRAEVIDNKDPDRADQPDPLGRLKILVPAIDGDSRLTERIAWPRVPIAGPGYGFKSLPPVGGYVWVEFERGRVDLPIWTGGWFAENDLPDDLKPTEAHGWFTPAGHQILMDEQSGSEFIRIKHKNGNTLIEMDSQGSIFITNASGQKVNVGKDADTANEPAVLGESLKGILEQLIDALVALQVSTAMGPAALMPTSTTQLQAIKGQLQRMLSQTVNLK